MPLLQRLGGEAGVAALVDELSARVKADPVMGPYFRDVDEAALNRHRSMFLSALLGGAREYTGRPLPEAHQPFRLGDREFDAFLRAMRDTLEHARVSALDRRRILRALQRLRHNVVHRSVPAQPDTAASGPDGEL